MATVYLLNYLDIVNKSKINYTYDSYSYAKREVTYVDIQNKENLFCIEQKM